jgi:signal transduction histidine kinase
MNGGQADGFHLPKIGLVGDDSNQTGVFSVHFFPLGQGEGTLLLFQDATEVAALEQRVLQQRNELALTEQALRQAKLEAEAANRAKSSFLGNVSHELRTPLNVIIGNTEILSDQDPPDMEPAERERYLIDIHDSGVYLLDLINDLLDLSKAEAGRMALIEEKIDLASLIEEALSMVGAQPYATGLDFTREIERPPPRLFADRRGIKQVLLNLLTNAAKSTPRGGRITVKAYRDKDRGLAIQVSDTGVGIAPEHLETLTEPFVQIARADTNHRGTGLGLYLVKTLVAMHGGEMTVESELGAGTTFTVLFPAERLLGTV